MKSQIPRRSCSKVRYKSNLANSWHISLLEKMQETLTFRKYVMDSFSDYDDDDAIHARF